LTSTFDRNKLFVRIRCVWNYCYACAP